MKTSVQWLRNYVDIPWNVNEMADRLTFAGLEVEGIESVGGVPTGIVVGQILTREKHPNADKLSVCTVDVGEEAPLQIVCGAPNCDAGNKVPVARIGTDFGDGFVIKQSKLRGVESFGMMCSSRELGLGQDHDGLMILPEETQIGLDFNQLTNQDHVVDWEVTPNRPDWLSHIGIAREIAALKGDYQALRIPEVVVHEVAGTDIKTKASVVVEDYKACPRYIARLVCNVKVGPSPEWMVRALESIGLRSINNVVDISNYVMYECGQPLHTFDYDSLAGHQIVVRLARENEKIQTLDDKEFDLLPTDIVIADAEKAVGLAGVMGGLNSEIKETTTNVLVESACFDGSAIRATAKRLNQHSDASYRFSRGSDFERAEWASLRTVQLLCELCGGELVAGSIDCCEAPYVAHHVTARFERIRRLIGMPLTNEEIVGYYRALGLGIVEVTEEKVTVSVPSYRLDITREADLIEEAVRLYGLDNVQPARPAAVLGGGRSTDAYYPIQQLREDLLSLGLTETMTYSLVSREDAVQGTTYQEENLIRLSNPLSAELAYMRTSLSYSLLQTTSYNVARNNHDLRFFELGRVFVNDSNLPEERWMAAIGMTGKLPGNPQGLKHEPVIDFYDMKGVVEGLLACRHITNYECRAAEHPAFRKGHCAEYVVGNEVVATIGEMVGTKKMRLRQPLFGALIEFNVLVKLGTSVIKFKPLPQYPATQRDITLVAATDMPIQTITKSIQCFGGKLMEKVELVDVFSNDQLTAEGKHSLSFQLTYRDPAATLTDEKVNKEHERIRRVLAQKLAVELR